MKRNPFRLDAASRDLVRSAVREDLGRRGDLTTRCFLPPGGRYSARIVFREAGVLCGAPAAAEVFRRICPRARVTWRCADGTFLRAGAAAAIVRGPREILTAERTALNFLQRLSGIATLTRRYVREARGTRAAVLDTRKTLPGWRALAKYAVRTGGGANHRMGLYDMVLLKDNHLAGWRPEEAARRVASFRRTHPRVPIEIEAKTHAEVVTALRLGADMILLDNMPPPALRREIRFIRATGLDTLIEISGGVDLKSVGRLARLGPDRISVGRLTHSAPALDISMELE